MSNTFGSLFKVTTFGESHGKACGVVIDGCPSGITITEEEIQKALKERKPKSSIYTTQRNEEDIPIVLSGIYQNKTLGTPITICINNKDAKSSDYSNIKNIFRPSHADHTWSGKHEIVDYRGGGRSSARTTVAVVAASALSNKILEKYGIKIHSFLTSIKGLQHKGDIDYSHISPENIFAPNNESKIMWQEELNSAISQGNSLGGIVEVHIKGCPTGLGEPVFNKLNASLASAMFSIPAVKGLEIGTGFNITNIMGKDANDSLAVKNESLRYTSNHNGGIIGGISNGEDIILKVAFKPTSSISIPQKTVDSELNEQTIQVKGRHDPCVAIRGSVVCKAMCSLSIADAILNKKLNKFTNI